MFSQPNWHMPTNTFYMVQKTLVYIASTIHPNIICIFISLQILTTNNQHNNSKEGC